MKNIKSFTIRGMRFKKKRFKRFQLSKTKTYKENKIVVNENFKIFFLVGRNVFQIFFNPEIRQVVFRVDMYEFDSDFVIDKLNESFFDFEDPFSDQLLKYIIQKKDKDEPDFFIKIREMYYGFSNKISFFKITDNYLKPQYFYPEIKSFMDYVLQNKKSFAFRINPEFFGYDYKYLDFFYYCFYKFTETPFYNDEHIHFKNAINFVINSFHSTKPLFKEFNMEFSKKIHEFYKTTIRYKKEKFDYKTLGRIE